LKQFYLIVAKSRKIKTKKENAILYLKILNGNSFFVLIILANIILRTAEQPSEASAEVREEGHY